MFRIAVALLALIPAAAPSQCFSGRCASGRPFSVPYQPIPVPAPAPQPAPLPDSFDVSRLVLGMVPSKPGHWGLAYSTPAGQVFIGDYDPEAQVWTGADGKTRNLRDEVRANNPGPNTGVQPAAAPPRGESKGESRDADFSPGARPLPTTLPANLKVGATPDAPERVSIGEILAALPVAGPPADAAKPRDLGPPPANRADLPPDGVITDKLRNDNRDHFMIGALEVSRAEAMEAIQAANEVPDDSGRVRFTVIGGADARAKVLRDVNTPHPALSPIRATMVVASYSSDHWRVVDGKFLTPKNPQSVMIYVQKPDGTNLMRQEGYEGPVKLAGALRDHVPGYDPDKDPGPHNVPLVRPIEPNDAPGGSHAIWWAIVIVIGGGACFAVLLVFVAAAWAVFRKKG